MQKHAVSLHTFVGYICRSGVQGIAYFFFIVWCMSWFSSSQTQLPELCMNSNSSSNNQKSSGNNDLCSLIIYFPCPQTAPGQPNECFTARFNEQNGTTQNKTNTRRSRRCNYTGSEKKKRKPNSQLLVQIRQMAACKFQISPKSHRVAKYSQARTINFVEFRLHLLQHD